MGVEGFDEVWVAKQRSGVEEGSEAAKQRRVARLSTTYRYVVDIDEIMVRTSIIIVAMLASALPR